MIVATDDHGKQDSYNGPTIRPPERVARRRRSLSPLPDYEASEAQYRKSSAFDDKTVWHQSRMWRIILFLLLTYTFLTIVVGVPIIVSQIRRHRNGDADDYSSTPNLLSNQFASSVPSITYANDMSCNTWNNTTVDHTPVSYTATLGMQLPVMGDISIRSNATLDDTPINKLSGNLYVEYDPNLNNDNAQIYVTLHTSTPALRESTLVCYSDDGDNRGVSIFFPDTMMDEDQIAMDIRVTFPRTINPASVPNFNVFLPMFTQEYQDLTTMNFESVSIDGSFRPISVTNIQAPRITVKNMIGDIIGAFNASEGLVLNTLQGVVAASVTLVKPLDRSSPTKFLLDTGNQRINANISLVSPSNHPPSSSLYFVGNVNNFNAPINVTFDQHDSPPIMPVSITVQNSLDATDIVMDHSFEGLFSADSRLGRVSVDQGAQNSKNDSFRSDKLRTIVYNEGSTSSRATGWIGQGQEASNSQSRISVYSSLGPINLHFGSA